MAVDYKALKNSGFMHQVQKDHFSLRLKVVGGNLTAEQLFSIAEISKKYGNGQVHLTSRQGVEIPFIKLADVDSVKAELEAGGVNIGTCGARVRTVTACQGDKVCPNGCIDAYSLALDISERYSGRELPHKFKFGVTGCMNNCIRAEGNDLGIKGVYAIEWNRDACKFCGVCIKACRSKAITQIDGNILLDESSCSRCGRCVKTCPFDAWKGESGYILSFGGIFGYLISTGKQFPTVIRDKETLFRMTDSALNYFERHGKPGERFRSTIERTGWDKLKGEIEAVVTQP